MQEESSNVRKSEERLQLLLRAHHGRVCRQPEIIGGGDHGEVAAWHPETVRAFGLFWVRRDRERINAMAAQDAVAGWGVYGRKRTTQLA